MTQIMSQCGACVRYRSGVLSGTPLGACEAFPDGDGIPAAVFGNQVDHRHPVEGDHGIRWEGTEFPDWAFRALEVTGD